MKKIQVDKCFHCPLMKRREGWGNYCEHLRMNHREIKLINIIPDWCPLLEDI